MTWGGTDTIPLEDQAARERALATGGSFLVQAPAGSGKTELLTLRFLHLLAVVDEPHEILAITFTRAATAEMRTRVIQALEDASSATRKHNEDPERVSPRMEAARAALRNDAARGWKLLEQPQLLNIETIDSLCLAIAHETPLLSRLGGSLTPTEDAEPLYALAARRTLGRLGGAIPELSAAIHSLLELRETSLSDCEQLIAGMLHRRDQWGDVLPLAAADAQSPDWLAVESHLEAPFRRERRRVMGAARAFFASHRDEFDELRQLAVLAGSDPESLREIREPEQLVEYEHWAGVCDFLLTKESCWRKRGQGFPSGKAGIPAKRRFLGLIGRLSQDPALLSIFRELRNLPPEGYSPEQWLLLKDILMILRYAAAELRVVFAERGVVDFVELGLAAREVLRDEHGAPSEMAADLALRWPHLLIDEFQDTSRAHYDLLALLAGGRETVPVGTFFLVGDPMQSIYGFRQAEVELFEATRRTGLGRGTPAPALEPLELKMNFRSHAGVVDRLNELFRKVFSNDRAGDGYHVAFVPSTARKPAPEGMAKSVHVMAQLLPTNAGAEEKIAARQTEASQVLRIIQQHAQEMEVAKREGRAFRIAVLARAKQHLTAIVRQLRDAAIPFRAIEIEELSERQEVLDLKALVCALMQPMDRIAWLTALRAPWCGLTLRDLHILCGNDDPGLAKRPVLELLRTRISLLSPEGQQRASRVAATLEDAMREKHRQISLSRWVERLWWTLGGRACVDLAGYENVLAFFRMFEQLPPYGAQLDQQLNRVFAQPDPRASERNGVQLMTIHKAKGLEFDVVIVPGLERKTANDSQALLCWLERTRLENFAREGFREMEQHELLVAPIGRKGADTEPLYRWIRRQQEDREAEEAKRLLYVAATRASRELHLMGTATVKSKPDGTSAIQPGSGKNLLSTAWPALEESFAAAWRSQRPGTGAGQNPAACAGADTEPVTKKLHLRRLPSDWRPEHHIGTTTVTIPPAPPRLDDPRDHPFERPAGSREARAVGLVVHALFEEAAQRPGDPPQDLLRETGRWRPRAVAMLRHAGLPKAEADARSRTVIQALQSALEDETGRWILASRRESQTESSWSAWEDSDSAGSTLHTVRADRIFRAGAEPGSRGETHLWIVDYKTGHLGGGELNAFLSREKEKYSPQLASYAEMVRRAHGKTIELRLALYHPLLKQFQWWPG
jgi:ATP-dependent helicase/nuclease subunit A